MSFPGGDSRADTSGAEEEGGKTGEEIAPSGSVFAVLQAYATHVFAPAVRAYAAARGGDDKASALINACLVAGDCNDWGGLFSGHLCPVLDFVVI